MKYVANPMDHYDRNDSQQARGIRGKDKVNELRKLKEIGRKFNGLTWRE